MLYMLLIYGNQDAFEARSPQDKQAIFKAHGAFTEELIAKGAYRYGEALKPRRLVGLRGVGTAFDGLYFTEQVTSTLKRGEFSQKFTLVRNGLVSTMERIPV